MFGIIHGMKGKYRFWEPADVFHKAATLATLHSFVHFHGISYFWFPYVTVKKLPACHRLIPGPSPPGEGCLFQALLHIFKELFLFFQFQNQL